VSAHEPPQAAILPRSSSLNPGASSVKARPVIHNEGAAMAKLNAKRRNSLPKKDFGEPGARKYPMPDRSHAANAKARATQQVKKGSLSPAERSRIVAKANRILHGGG
jgi:hypothetical protein